MDALAPIRDVEKFRSRPYRCSAGRWTQGYGSTFNPHTGQAITRDSPEITEAKAAEWLAADCEVRERSIHRLVTVPLLEHEAAAVLCFTFNVGRRGLEQSTLLRKLNRGDRAGAAAEFGRWIYAGGKPSEGLKIRRWRERHLFMYGEWPTWAEAAEAVG